ncbi:MAG: hypothetical protein IJC57_03125 [Clostridia bacterium]|nr:hypothetical protein [Clostridia bacterium]
MKYVQIFFIKYPVKIKNNIYNTKVFFDISSKKPENAPRNIFKLLFSSIHIEITELKTNNTHVCCSNKNNKYISRK